MREITEEQRAEFIRDLNAKYEPRRPQPLSMKHIFWGVFLGLLAFSVTAGIIYSAVH